MIKNLKKFYSKGDTHKEQGTCLTSTQCKQHSGNVMQEIVSSDSNLQQVHGGGASHVAASSDPYAIPYGLHLH